MFFPQFRNILGEDHLVKLHGVKNIATRVHGFKQMKHLPAQHVDFIGRNLFKSAIDMASYFEAIATKNTKSVNIWCFYVPFQHLNSLFNIITLSIGASCIIINAYSQYFQKLLLL